MAAEHRLGELCDVVRDAPRAPERLGRGGHPAGVVSGGVDRDPGAHVAVRIGVVRVERARVARVEELRLLGRREQQLGRRARRRDTVTARLESDPDLRLARLLVGRRAGERGTGLAVVAPAHAGDERRKGLGEGPRTLPVLGRVRHAARVVVGERLSGTRRRGQRERRGKTPGADGHDAEAPHRASPGKKEGRGFLPAPRLGLRNRLPYGQG